MEPMKLPLPCSVSICHIPLFISINYHKKVAGCEVSTEITSHGASDNETSHRAEPWCGSPLFRLASFKPQFQTHPHTSPSPQTAGKLKEEGARYKAADPPAPTGLQNEWAARCRQSARGHSQVYASTKGNIKRPHSERLLQRGQILLPYMKHYTDQFTVA